MAARRGRHNPAAPQTARGTAPTWFTTRRLWAGVLAVVLVAGGAGVYRQVISRPNVRGSSAPSQPAP